MAGVEGSAPHDGGVFQSGVGKIMKVASAVAARFDSQRQPGALAPGSLDSAAAQCSVPAKPASAAPSSSARRWPSVRRLFARRRLRLRLGLSRRWNVRPEGDGLLFCWDTGRRTNALHHRIPDSLTVTQLRFEEKAGPLTAERALTLTNGAARPIIYFFHPFQRFAFCLPIARNSAWTRDRWHRDPPSNGFPGCLPLTGQHGKPNGVSMSPTFCWRVVST